MSSNKCARCDQTVYPVEGLRCLDKIWHKGCFKCHECNMTLNLKNYKGFEKRPYCNAHCPQAKATTVADTPEIRRLAENTRIQSQAKYHEDFEKSKGKGFTAIADDPETLRIKETSKIISNVAYHGELERKKQMEERRGRGGAEDDPSPSHVGGNNNNNNSNHNNGSNIKHQNNVPQRQDSGDFASPNHQSQIISAQNHQYQMQRQMQQQQIQQQQQQQQQALQQKQLLHKQQQQQIQKQKQQQQQQQMQHYAQDHNGQPIMIRQQQIVPDSIHQQVAPVNKKQLHHHHQQQPPFPLGPQQQQQLLIMRQQQQYQQQMMLARQSSEPALPMNRQVPKQMANNNHLQHPGQPMMKQQMIPMQGHPQQQQQQHMNMMHPPAHLIGGPLAPQQQQHLMNQAHLGAMPNGQRVAPNQAMVAVGPPGAHHMIRGYNNQQPQQYQVAAHLDGAAQPMPKQQPPPQFINQPQRHLIHPGQIHQVMNHPANQRPHPQQQQQQHHHQQQLPPQMHPSLAHQQVSGRVFKAMYDYVANDCDEVSFFDGDILVDCVNVDRNWLIGKVARSGETGMLPANYVAELPSQ